MSVNLNAAAFLNVTQTDYSKKNIAELYMQVYQYAAEDFPNHPDLARYIADLTLWMKSVDQRLEQQMSIISSHTHKIPPHTHGVISHSSTTPTSLITNTPVQSSSIVWTPISYPIFINTSLAVPNMVGNNMTISVASEGNILPTFRRTLPIPLTLIPKLSPVLQEALIPSL